MCLMRFPSSCEMKTGCQPYKLSAHSIQNPLFCFHPRDIRKNRFSHISGMKVLKHKKYIKLIKFHTPDQVYTVFTIYTRSGIIISPRCGSEYVGPVRLTAFPPQHAPDATLVAVFSFQQKYHYHSNFQNIRHRYPMPECRSYFSFFYYDSLFDLQSSCPNIPSRRQIPLRAAHCPSSS